MISLGNRNGRKGLQQRFISNKREMEETELEEGEACSYHDDDDDTTIDPDVALSYIDEKLQNYLGHFKKDFEGVFSAESLGAKYGIYGSFLPAHRRSPHSRTPPRVQNNITPQSQNTLQAEGGHHDSIPPANVSSSIKQGSASAGSASSHAYKPPQKNNLCRKNVSTKSIQSVEERTPKSEVLDQQTLKVRIKVGSENLLVKKNAAIYSGLGLDESPTSSLDDSPMESEGLSCRLSFDGFESPTHILQMMVSSPLFEGCFLSPLPNDLMCLSERPNYLQDLLTQWSFKENPEISFIGLPSVSVKDQETIFGVKSKRLANKNKLVSQDNRDEKDNSIDSPFPLLETNIDAVSCEELVSNALKLPLLSNAHKNMKGSTRASLNEWVFSDALNKELLEPFSGHVSVSEKPEGMTASSGKPLHNKAANVGDGKSETEDRTADVGASLNSRKDSKIGLKDPVNLGSDKSTSCNDGIGLPCAIEQSLSGDGKRPKKTQVQGISTKQIVMETNKDSAKLLKDRKHIDSEINAQRIEVQKDSTTARDQYIDVFGEMNETEVDIMDSPDVTTGEMLKSSDVVDTTTRMSSLARKGTNSGSKLRGSSNGASMSVKGHPLSESAPIPVDGNDNWVQCDKCQKWRMFPPGSKVDNLPAEWDCSLMTWLPHKNHCSVSEEESNKFHAPPPDTTAANVLSAVGPINGINASIVKKTTKLPFQDSPNGLSSSTRKKQKSVKDKTQKEAKEEHCLMNGINIQQPPKSSDMYHETGQHKKIDKHRTDCYSDGGHPKVTNRKGRRGPDHDLPRESKKSKTQSIQNGNNDPAAINNQCVDILGVSSDFVCGAAAAGKDRGSNSENFALENSKDAMSCIASDPSHKLNFQVEQLPIVSSVHVSKSGNNSKKRKGDNFKDFSISGPSSGKLVDDYEKSSRKRHRTSKSKGKESSSSKRSGNKADMKSKNVSHYKLESIESLQKDSSCANPVVAATSSSSKVSGSLKVKCKFQGVKGSPVDSVSSSPSRILKSDKLASESKIVVMKDNAQHAVNLASNSPIRFSTSDFEGDHSGAVKKDQYETGTFHCSPNYSTVDIQDKSKGIKQLTNGNGCIDDVKSDDEHPPEAQASECVNETTRGEVQFDSNVSNSDKSWKDSPSLSKVKNQNSKTNYIKGKVKASSENSLDYTSVSKERELDKKVKVEEKCRSNTHITEKNATMHNKESPLPKSEGTQEYDQVDKSEDLVPVSAKEKSHHLPCSGSDKNETSNLLQPCQGGKTSTSACDAPPDSGIPRESRLNKKSDSHNVTHLPSKHPISNGHKIKNQDVPSPLRRDPSSQAASSAIKEAKNLKHLADRLKSSGSRDSTGMYFEAALKFLHGASLLEFGKNENIKHADITQSVQIYSSTAKLCQFCAYEFEKSKDMATAALAYKCVEVAYLRVIYSSHNTASRDRHELQLALQMVPPGESPSSSASDIDNLNNTANGDKVTQARSGGSPQLAANLVIAAKNRPNFSRIVSFAQDVNSAMEASRKSRIAFAAANGSMSQSDSKDGISSIKRALDFNFHDVDGLLRLVRLAKEAIIR